MNRTLRRQILYFGCLAALGVAVVGLLYSFRAPPWTWVLSALLFLIPGRIAGHYFRNLFTGRRLMDTRRYADALPFLEHFLAQIRARPGLKQLIWLHAGIYSRDVEAMTLNNIGTCQLELGNLDRVAEPLQEALAIDPEYPIAYVNLAHLAARRGDLDAARAAAGRAWDLGYRDSWVDTLIQGASSALAKLEGHGKL
jgi:tetratricopeptide (TPR) repeat protein